MSRKERKRAKLLERVKRGELKLRAIAEISGLSKRSWPCREEWARELWSGEIEELNDGHRG